MRVLEACVAVLSMLAADHFFGLDNAPAYASATVAFAMLFALGLLSAYTSNGAKNGFVLLWDVLLPMCVWVLSESTAVWTVKWIHHEYQPGFQWFVCWGACTAAGVILCRLARMVVNARGQRRRAGSCTVAVVGRGAHCAEFIRGIARMRDSRYRIDAQLDVSAEPVSAQQGVTFFQDIEAFTAYVRAHRIDELWLALPLSDEKTLLRFLDIFRDDLLNIRFVPDVSRVALFHGDIVDLGGTPAINLVASPLTANALTTKAVFDRVFAFCALFVTSPVLLAIALAVKWTSPGPVIFSQRRQGANGEPFDIYKFRTMHTHAPDDGVVVQATRGDPRITPLGAFLRRTSLDELPQFFNVLRGDMSVVGPRPHAIEHDAIYEGIVDGYVHRYRIKPGITGWAQINGLRGETDSIEKMQRRVEHDLYYLGNWSFALDMQIVLATVTRGFVHSNAY